MFIKALCCSAMLFTALGLLGVRLRRVRGRCRVSSRRPE
jgi:hypothetical protein